MINSNLRTQLQAKINAATAATSRSDLMLMRVAAQGLNLDETNLDTLLATKINAVTSADPAVDFVEAWRSLGLDGNVQYTCPFDTSPGDVLFVDQIGGVKREAYPTVGIATTSATLATELTGVPFQTRVGSVVPGSYSTAFAALTLSDGNLLLAALSYDGNTSISTLCVTVVDPVNSAVLQRTTYNPAVGGVSSLTYNQLIGAFEVSANTFRFWMSVPGSGGEATSRQVGYFTISYNTVSKQTSYAVGASVMTDPNMRDAVAMNYQVQGEKFLMFRISNNDTYCIDMAASTVTKYTGLTGQSTGWSRFDHSSVGNEYARVVYGSTVKLAKGGVNTLADLPANLTSDGCFSSGNNVMLIGAGMWLCVNATTRVAKLVKFNTTYTTCSIYTLGTLPADVSASVTRVTKQGDNYTAYTSGHAFTFSWTGDAAPVRVNLNRRFPRNCAYGADAVAICDGNTRYVTHYGAYVIGGANPQYSRLILIFDVSEFLPMLTKKFGVVVTGAVAGQPSEVALIGTETTINSSVSTGFDIVSHGGLLTSLSIADPTAAFSIYIGGSTTAKNSDFVDMPVDWLMKTRSVPTLSTSNGVYFFKGECLASAQTYRQDPTYAGSIGILTSRGLVSTSASSSDAASRGIVVASLKSGALAFAVGSGANFNGEIPR